MPQLVLKSLSDLIKFIKMNKQLKKIEGEFEGDEI